MLPTKTLITMCDQIATSKYFTVDITSLVPRPMLAPSQNGLAHQAEILGCMGRAASLLIDYLRFEMLYEGLLRSLQ